MKQSTCFRNIMKIRWTVFLWHRKQMFPCFLDHPVCYEKLGHILKHLVPNILPALFAHFRDIAEKTGPREPETDSN